MKITRRIEFDAGHRVLGHEGRCKRLHGHRYAAEVTVEAGELDNLGRVVDFGEIKRLVKGWIDENWDHSILVNTKDPLARFLDQDEEYRATSDNHEPYFMDTNPTAENMAGELYGICFDLLKPLNVNVVNIRIYETPSCWADFPG